jgi:hypothetical protein
MSWLWNVVLFLLKASGLAAIKVENGCVESSGSTAKLLQITAY